MTDSDYACPECDGYGVMACEYCGSDDDCESCRGTGCDPELIDVAAWAEAVAAFPGPSWDWETEGHGKTLGRMNEAGDTLALADYTRGALANPQPRLPGL